MKETNKNTFFSKNSFTTNILLLALFLSIAIGLICGYFYQASPRHVISIGDFQKELLLKENLADETIVEMNEVITHSTVDSLIRFPFPKNDLSFYVIEKSKLVFWSDNQRDVSSISLPDSTEWHYVQIPNAYCVTKLVTLGGRKFLELIIIKDNYPYENDELINRFASGFNIDKQVQVQRGHKTDKLAIFSEHGSYLFTLAEPKTPVYNESYADGALIAYALVFLFFFILYARTPTLIRKKTIELYTFLLISGVVGVVMGAAMYFKVPSLFFLSKVFSPFQYASNPLLASIVHLSVATGYFISTIYLFYNHTDIDKFETMTYRVIIHLFYVLNFILIFYLFRGLYLNSSIQLSILQFKDFSVLGIWIHFMMLVWGLGLALLFFRTHAWFKKNQLLRFTFLIELIAAVIMFFVCRRVSPDDAVRLSVSFIMLCIAFYLPFIFPKYRNLYGFLAFWVLVFTAFVVWNSYMFNQSKQYEKYKVLAQNMSVNGTVENDRMADILLEELDQKIINDSKIDRLVTKRDSVVAANDYLDKKYLRGFWSKYDMRLNVASVHSDVYNGNVQYIDNFGTQLKNTHFYSIPANENNISYIGVFQSKQNPSDSLYYFMEFYPRRNFKSYSFPNLLIPSSPALSALLQNLPQQIQ